NVERHGRAGTSDRLCEVVAGRHDPPPAVENNTVDGCAFGKRLLVWVGKRPNDASGTRHRYMLDRRQSATSGCGLSDVYLGLDAGELRRASPDQRAGDDEVCPGGYQGDDRVTVRDRPAATVDCLHLDGDVDRVPGRRPIPQYQPVIRVAVVPAAGPLFFRHEPARDHDD